MRKYSSYILFMLITLLVGVLSLNGIGPLDSAQRSINDFLVSFTASDEIDRDIVLVTIDGKTMNEFGQWPWNYDITGDLIAACGHGDPKTIAVDFFLTDNFYQDSAGYTDILAEQIDWLDRVVLPYDIALTTFRDDRTNNPPYLFDYSVTIDNPLGLMDEKASLQVRKVFLPPAKVLEASPLLGYDYIIPDDDRTVRYHPLVMNYEGYYYPSLPLLTAAHYLDIKPEKIIVSENNHVSLNGQRSIPVNAHTEFYVNFPKLKSFRQISAYDILTEKYELSKLKNKIVLITVDDVKNNQLFKTAVDDITTRAQIKASIIQNIINDNLIQVPYDRANVSLLLIFVLGALFAFALPQVNNMYRFIILGGTFIVLANVSYFLFISFQIFFDVTYLALEMVLFMIAAPLLDSELLGMGKKDASNKAINKLPKAEIPEAEQIKKAPVRELKDSPTDTGNINTTAFAPDTNGADEKTSALKSTDTPEEITSFDHQTINIDDNEPSVKTTAVSDSDIEPVIITPDASDDINITTDDNVIYGINNTDADETKLSDSGPIKQLGRYEILGTLGMGAMGHVYKGVDPAINRPVALKTIRLDFVNDPEEMEELKERLYREAQAAGKLSHPNIVTIYDVGSEGQLQYIAMEYLEGRTLEDMIKKKVNFNYRIIAKIIIQICNALEYAHDKGIVHRDIKPANIMILKDYSVKLMDYGIARIDSNSMTKTGIAMGTPNYISPEQLKGETVDNRADIFSLGVVIYELLLGRRPFKGENITSLIYSIINNEPEKPSNLNPQIPLLFDHIIERALKKDPKTRYQRAADLIHDLNDFVESFSIK